jgi:hypothetical protein
LFRFIAERNQNNLAFVREIARGPVIEMIDEQEYIRQGPWRIYDGVKAILALGHPYASIGQGEESFVFSFKIQTCFYRDNGSLMRDDAAFVVVIVSLQQGAGQNASEEYAF